MGVHMELVHVRFPSPPPTLVMSAHVQCATAIKPIPLPTGLRHRWSVFSVYKHTLNTHTGHTYICIVLYTIFHQCLDIDMHASGFAALPTILQVS